MPKRGNGPRRAPRNAGQGSRDFLREHPDEARAYAEEKRRAAAASGGERDRYVEGKDEYVAVLEQRALAWAEARPADR